MNFLIKYTIENKLGGIIKEGEIKVKNKKDSMDAQISLEKYFKKKHKGFYKITVNSCEEDSSLFVGFDGFEKIFGKDNPFK